MDQTNFKVGDDRRLLLMLEYVLSNIAYFYCLN